MSSFRLKTGQHTSKGRTYNQGEVVESDRDLIRCYGQEKFEKCSDAEVKEQKAKSKKKGEEDDEEDAAPALRQDPVVAGSTDPRGKPLDKDNVHDLAPKDEDDKKSKSKKAKKVEAEEESDEESDDAEEDEGDEEEEITSKLGENVTSDYPKAVEAELLVFKKGRNHYVTDRDTPQIPLQKEGLAKGALGKFLAKQLKKD